MRRLFTVVVLSGLVLSGCKSPPGQPAKFAHAPVEDTLDSFRARAARYQSVVTVPEFETSSGQVLTAVTNAMAAGDAALDQLGKLTPSQVTFENTVGALDDISYQAGLTANRIELLKETSTNKLVRDAAQEASKQLQEWAVGLDYREDVYRAVTAYATRQPSLSGERARLLSETLRDYRRAGLALPANERAQVEAMRKELSRLSTDFETHVTEAQKSVRFTAAELQGVPENFLKQFKTGPDEYTVKANVTFQYIAVMDNARDEAARRKLLVARDTLAEQENVPLLRKILELRQQIARKLGYASWADYGTEPKMAKTGAAATAFLERLKKGLEPKFQAELERLRQMKVKDTSDANATIRIWDWRYYNNQLKKQQYTIDSEALRVYFPYDRVLQGMFSIYERIFGIVIGPVDAPHKWVEDLKLYAVSDSKTGEPLGLFYLDMFPREGKYNHFAHFAIIEGKRLAAGPYQRPTVALICNFPTPQAGQPSLLTHQEVETLFHEFGHAMHSILTRANFARFSGTSVPRDFVEAPSQMLERWVWDKQVLDGFAADYRDPSKKIPESVLNQLKSAKLATEGIRYRRQLSFGLTDLYLHTRPDAAADPVKLSNQTLSEVFLPVADNTAFVAYFGHIIGYDAAYYGYAWADAIAADLATVFENAPGRYFDEEAGRRLRKEIYEPGDSREASISIRRFLGRERSLAPFLRSLGIEPDEPLGTKENLAVR